MDSRFNFARILWPRLEAIKGTRFVRHSLSFREGCAGGEHDGAHRFLEVVSNRRGHSVTLTNARGAEDALDGFEYGAAGRLVGESMVRKKRRNRAVFVMTMRGFAAGV